MKASEVLAQYATGTRNFQGVNLRGQSFKGQNLAGANFSQADLRSTNFSNTNLTGANFTDVKCGLQKRWATILAVLSWLLAAISGFLSNFVSYSVSLIFNTTNLEHQLGGWVSLIVVVIFVIITIRRGILAGAVFAGAVAVAGATVAAEILGAAVFVGVVGTVAGAAAAAVFAVAALAVAGAVALVVAGAGAIAGVAFVVLAVPGANVIFAFVAFAYTVAFAFAVALLAAYIGWRGMEGDRRDAWIRSFAVAFAAIKGTNFRGANLTDANFSSVRLKSTDMREATLTRVRWYGANMLDRIRPGNSYLKSNQVRQWLIGKGTDKNFDDQQLQGVNFQGADLTDASFINANLNQANLQDADLSRAKLIQTQLDKTDFTGATLTGACIEDWGITTHTKLDDVKCKYIFMRSPTKEDPNPRRKPDNWEEVFTGNDFADFIKPIQDTLDLYHNQGVDPRAIAIAWKQLIENNPDAQLQFKSLEVKGEGNLLLRFITAMGADLSQLNGEYFTLYNQLKGLTEAEVKSQLEQDKQTRDRENFLKQALDPNPIKTIKIFLASSSELASDRREFEIFINRKNKEYIKQNIFLELVLWEDFIDAMSSTRLQDEYNKAVQDCDIFISLFHTQVEKSTEEEFLKALATFKANGKPLIYTYFNQARVEITPQIVSILNFKQKLKDMGHIYTKYENIDDLKFQFSEQLAKTMNS